MRLYGKYYLLITISYLLSWDLDVGGDAEQGASGVGVGRDGDHVGGGSFLGFGVEGNFDFRSFVIECGFDISEAVNS